MTEQKYKIKSPIGNIMAKDIMTAKELREFIPSLIKDAEQASVWEEKAQKDNIEELIDCLILAGYEVTPLIK